MKVLAIGATGFIGQHVMRRLVRQGHEVVVFHRGRTETPLPDSTRHIYGNRGVLLESKKEFERFAPEVVLDMVPYTETQARQTVEVFSGLADRLVAVSSSDVYRNYDGWRGESDYPPDPVPLGEDAPLRETRYPYRGYEGLDFEQADDYDKILIERIAMNGSGLSGTVLRLPAVYGPGNKQHRFAPQLRCMIDERPVILLGERQARWRWTHGYVENVAAAIALAVADPRAAGCIYNVGERKTPTEKERVQKLGEAIGWAGEVVMLPQENLPDHLRTNFSWEYDLAIDTNRIRKELGYSEPVSWRKALKQTTKWEQANLPSVARGRQVDNYAAEDDALKGAV